MTVYDRWHKARPGPADEPCREHGKPRAADHGKPGRWQVRWRDDAARQSKENFAKRSDADARDAQVRASLAAGTYIDAAAGKVGFAAFAEQWRAMQVHRQSTGALAAAMRLYINPVIGELPLAAVRAGHVQQLVKRLSDELAPTTVHVVYGYVASIFKSAVEDRLIGRTPCRGIRLPAIPKRTCLSRSPRAC